MIVTIFFFLVAATAVAGALAILQEWSKEVESERVEK